MELSGMKKFLNALNVAGITKWEAITDTSPTHFYNNERSFNLLDEEESSIINISRGLPSSPYQGQLSVKIAHLGDVHEVAFASDSVDDIKKFIEAYGLTTTEDQNKILVNIKGTNYNLKPQTGDYLTFKELSESELASLSEEEKVKYQAELKAYNDKKNGFRGAMQVTV